MVLHAMEMSLTPDRAQKPERRYIALNLPLWPTDFLKRRDARLAGLTAPLVLYEKLNNAYRLVALDPLAHQAGLFPGQSLSDARAIMPGLVAQEVDHGLLETHFLALADWHSYASPIVGVETHWTRYGDLIIDITGTDHLFGGEERMLTGVIKRLADLGFHVQGAIASTIGAAVALSRHRGGTIVPVGEGDPPPDHLSGHLANHFANHLADHLADLPVSTLRLEPGEIEQLRQLGLKTIGQLYGRQRAGLRARLGPEIGLRLDQALGRADEVLVPRLPVPDCLVERRFGEPIVLVEDVLMSAVDLAHQLSERLGSMAKGGQQFDLMLYRVDHQVMHLSVNAARGTRDPGHIERLFRNRIDRLQQEFDAGYGIEMIRLGAGKLTDLTAAQAGMFAGPDGMSDITQLVDRLASRLGEQAVLRPSFGNSYIPERAVQMVPALMGEEGMVAMPQNPDVHRPLRLLPHPEEIRVFAEVPEGPPARMEWRRQTLRFVRASGPERIGVEWWRPGEGELTRDYYVAEDEAGQRFWLFREGLYVTETSRPRWFMHGFFA